MKKYIKRLALFCLPFLSVIPIEMSVRNNTFKMKSDYVQNNKDNIELFILGSSQNNKAINPEFLDFITASLANDGSTVNIDYLIFEEYYSKFPQLKVVIFEISYHSLEEIKPNNWNKNHLFLKFYNVNNYNRNPPLSERLLFLSNPKEYLKKYLTPESKQEDNKFNQFGYILNSSSRFEKYNYNKDLIKKTSFNEYLKGRHQVENLNFYTVNTSLLNKAIETCLKNNIKVVLLSPPKYYLYNNHLNKKRAERRNYFLKKYSNIQNIYIWNLEKKYEYNPNYFLNEDHLNYYGSKQFTTLLNHKLKQIIFD